MAKKKPIKKKKSPDFNELAFSIAEQATSDHPTINSTINGKNPHAVALGRLGGLKGGKARAEKLSAKKRQQIAKKAAKARWKK
jgi:hypothetical protein